MPRPSRFESAKAEVNGLINDLGGSNQMTLIHVGHTPTVLASATNDKTVLRRALADAQPTTATPNWEAALALAAGAAQGFRDGRVVIVSDGGLPDDLPPLPTAPIYSAHWGKRREFSDFGLGDSWYRNRAAVVRQRRQSGSCSTRMRCSA